ncbi:hypothetical protein COU76_02780 [Candidatus Peregrinibacteria bacterium CG10_big_fil_rev_8_21_14_0_10_49_10]|nr:MAG: hypothetical protein COU76_02780 [Candidatus Peregrinibacteria bacterium CG10_big_fil_rev_8_21_14_0_10_49_10]
MENQTCSFPDKLTDEQYAILSELVGTPSFNSQIPPEGSEAEIQQAIWRMLENHEGIRLSQLQVGDQSNGRFNILAQKGEPLEHTKFALMMYVHTDTIKKESNWENDYKLTRGTHGFLQGVGVYDMKAGVMMLIDLLQTIDVPPGATVVGVFGVGEERNSDGMKRLLKWDGMEKMNMVLSPEICPQGEADERANPEIDAHKRIITGRPGHIKIELVSTVPPSHAHDLNKPGANDVLNSTVFQIRESIIAIARKQFGKDFNFGEKNFSVPHQQTFGSKESASRTTKAIGHMGIHIVSPLTEEWVRGTATQVKESLEKRLNWYEHGIGVELGEWGVSYPAYVTPTDTPEAEALLDWVGKFYGSAAWRPSQKGAWADSNLGADFFNRLNAKRAERPSILSADGSRSPIRKVGWYDIAPIGGRAHEGGEFVVEASVAQMCHCYAGFVRTVLPKLTGTRRT